MKMRTDPKSYSLIAVICVLMLLSDVLFAWPNDITEITKWYATVNKLIADNKTRQILSYLKQDSERQDDMWIMVRGADSQVLYEKSFVKAKTHVYGGRIVKATILMENESGDWENLSEYYFYESGVSAFVFQKLITFHAYDTTREEQLPPGPYISEKTSYFGGSGEKIKSGLKAYIAKSKKEIDPKFVYHPDIDEYESVKALPFYKLIEKELKY